MMGPGGEGRFGPLASGLPCGACGEDLGFPIAGKPLLAADAGPYVDAAPQPNL